MILFIDDERRSMSSYVEELERQLAETNQQKEVVFLSDVDKALETFNDRFREIEVVVLDIMMPFGKHFDKESTDGGLRTGERFYEHIRRRTLDLSVVILSNVNDARLSKRFSTEEHCWFLQKKDYFPYEFAEAVTEVMPH
jgi:DNA-binding NarL/FixJ family response regulator